MMRVAGTSAIVLRNMTTTKLLLMPNKSNSQLDAEQLSA